MIQVVELEGCTVAACPCGTMTVVISGAEAISPADTRAGLDELIAHARDCPGAACVYCVGAGYGGRDDDEHQGDNPDRPADPRMSALIARLVQGQITLNGRTLR